MDFKTNGKGFSFQKPITYLLDGPFVHCPGFQMDLNYMNLVRGKLGFMFVCKESSKISLCRSDSLNRDDTFC